MCLGLPVIYGSYIIRKDPHNSRLKRGWGSMSLTTRENGPPTRICSEGGP